MPLTVLVTEFSKSEMMQDIREQDHELDGKYINGRN